MFLANWSVLVLDVARFPDSFRRPPTCTPPVMEITSAQRDKNASNTRKVGYTIRWYRMCCRCCSTPLQGSPGTGTASGYKEMARCMLPAVARQVPVQHALWVALDAGRCKLLQATACPPLDCSRTLARNLSSPKDNKQRDDEGSRLLRWVDEPRDMHVSCLI